MPNFSNKSLCEEERIIRSIQKNDRVIYRETHVSVTARQAAR